jgi:hypothetical protein
MLFPASGKPERGGNPPRCSVITQNNYLLLLTSFSFVALLEQLRNQLARQNLLV